MISERFYLLPCFYASFLTPGKVHKEPKAREELCSEHTIKLQNQLIFKITATVEISSFFYKSTDMLGFFLTKLSPHPSHSHS